MNVFLLLLQWMCIESGFLWFYSCIVLISPHDLTWFDWTGVFSTFRQPHMKHHLKFLCYYEHVHYRVMCISGTVWQLWTGDILRSERHSPSFFPGVSSQEDICVLSTPSQWGVQEASGTHTQTTSAHSTSKTWVIVSKFASLRSVGGILFQNSTKCTEIANLPKFKCKIFKRKKSVLIYTKKSALKIESKIALKNCRKTYSNWSKTICGWDMFSIEFSNI